jgi:hypothetical protein
MNLNIGNGSACVKKTAIMGWQIIYHRIGHKSSGHKWTVLDGPKWTVLECHKWTVLDGHKWTLLDGHKWIVLDGHKWTVLDGHEACQTHLLAHKSSEPQKRLDRQERDDT